MINQKNFQTEQCSIRVTYDTSEETRIKEIARLREKALHDEASALKHAWEEGYAKGYAEGYAEEQTDVIAKMKSAGFSESDIQRIFQQ